MIDDKILGLETEELRELVNQNPSLRGMIVGYAGEYKLAKEISANDRITGVYKPDDHDRTKKGDLVVNYRNRDIVIEVKSIQTNSIREKNGKKTGGAQCDASDRRKVKLPNGETIETTCLLVGGFDILAVSLYAFCDNWEFGYLLNSDLPRTTYRKYSENIRHYLLATMVHVTYPPSPPMSTNLFDMMDIIVNRAV